MPGKQKKSGWKKRARAPDGLSERALLVTNMNRSPDLILLDSAGAAAAETAHSGRQEKNLSRIDRRSTPKLKRTHHHESVMLLTSNHFPSSGVPGRRNAISSLFSAFPTSQSKGHWVSCSVSEEDMDGELC